MRLVLRGEGGSAPRAQVVGALAVVESRHAREPVRKPIERTPRADEERARGIEAQEPDAGHAADSHGRTTGEATRQRIVDATLETLRNEGFAGATSRAIARAGDFNQALIFYHFGTLDGLLLAALDKTSEEG